MKLGVLSDIHSNAVALKECIDYMEKEGVDEYLLLGDFVSDTPYARETMDMLYDFIKTHKCHVLRGNREEYMLSQREALLKSGYSSHKEAEEEAKNGASVPQNLWVRNSASGNLLYTYEHLTQEDLDFFESLPRTFVFEKEGYPSIICAHGSPASTRELLQLNEEPVKGWLEKVDTEYLLCAHTHYPGELEYKGKHYFNPGCIGIAIKDYGLAQCLILESVDEAGNESDAPGSCWNPEFLKIPYDNMKVVRDMFVSGLHNCGKWFINSNIQILTTGTDKSAALVQRAGELSEEPWPNISEEYFVKAAEELKIPKYRAEDFQ